MRKIVLILFTVLITLYFNGLSESIDLSQMSSIDLYNLKSSIEQELYFREEANEFVRCPGMYLVGEDIEPGRYAVTCIEAYSSVGYMFVQQNIPNPDYKEGIDEPLNKWKILSSKLKPGQKFSFSFKEGDYFISQEGIVIVIKE